MTVKYYINKDSNTFNQTVKFNINNYNDDPPPLQKNNKLISPYNYSYQYYSKWCIYTCVMHAAVFNTRILFQSLITQSLSLKFDNVHFRKNEMCREQNSISSYPITSRSAISSNKELVLQLFNVKLRAKEQCIRMPNYWIQSSTAVHDVEK